MTDGSSQEISRHRFCFSGLSAESHSHSYRNTFDPWIFHGDSPKLVEKIEKALVDFVPQPERFVGQFLRFYEALEHNTALPVTLQDARALLELITAMYDSAQIGRSVLPPMSPEPPTYDGWQP